jgi:hypothetical protein
MHLKTGYTWRQIVKTPSFAYCSGMKLGGLIPFVENRIKGFRHDFPNLAWDCPLQPGNYSAWHVYNFTQNLIATRVNFTQITTEKPKIFDFETNENGFNVMIIPLVNGIYANVLHMTTKDDPVGSEIKFQFEWRERLGDDKF